MKCEQGPLEKLSKGLQPQHSQTLLQQQRPSSPRCSRPSRKLPHLSLLKRPWQNRRSCLLRTRWRQCRCGEHEFSTRLHSTCRHLSTCWKSNSILFFENMPSDMMRVPSDPPRVRHGCFHHACIVHVPPQHHERSSSRVSSPKIAEACAAALDMEGEAFW